MLGCALLKVQLRELLTCLELETAWSLVKWDSEVSGTRPSFGDGLQGTGKRGPAFESPRVQVHFRMKLLPPGLAALWTPSFRFSSPHYGSVRPWARKLTRARATPVVSSFSFPAFEASLHAPVPNFLRIFAPCPSRHHRRLKQGVFPVPAVHR